MKIIFVTAKMPYGSGEPFIIPEIMAFVARGHDVRVVPTRVTGPIAHGGARRLVPHTLRAPLHTVAGGAIREAATAPLGLLSRVRSIAASRNARVAAKNAVVLPKALWLAGFARIWGAEHIHAYWASTPSTIAMLAAEQAGIPWSFTSFRWDIPENNLLAAKARSASFARVADSEGARELTMRAGVPGFAAQVVYSGVDIPETSGQAARADSGPDRFRIIVPANLVEKKGHIYLLRALAALPATDPTVHADFAGDGDLRASLEQEVEALGLTGRVRFLGLLPHDELLRRMTAGEWDIEVLPSVVTAAGEKEGIPIALVEAMARELAVISTTAGGMPELLADGAGLVVPERDANALKEAILRLVSDPAFRRELGSAGAARARESFSARAAAGKLEQRFLAAARTRD